MISKEYPYETEDDEEKGTDRKNQTDGVPDGAGGEGSDGTVGSTGEL